MYLNRLLVLLQANRQDLATRTSAYFGSKWRSAVVITYGL